MTVESHAYRARIISLLVFAVAGLLLSSFWHSLTAPAKTICSFVPTNEGSIVGVLSYVGVPPRRLRINTSADPVCSAKNHRLMTENELVRNGRLANVFVYIKDGTLADGTKLSDLRFPVPSTEAVLDQNGCRFTPHVLGLQVRQELKITNSDPTQHNIHPTPRTNEEYNYTQPSGGGPLVKTFNRAEVMIPVKCNQHPWMKAYVGVLSHPFFAVSNAAGAFEIKGVPAGTYTLVAWHEGGVAGSQEMRQIVVSAKGISTADFSFGSSTGSNQKSSLEMEPALDLQMISRH